VQEDYNAVQKYYFLSSQKKRRVKKIINKKMDDIPSFLNEQFARLSLIDSQRVSLAGKIATVENTNQLTDYCIELSQKTKEAQEILQRINITLFESFIQLDQEILADENAQKIFLLTSLIAEKMEKIVRWQIKEQKQITYILSFLNHLTLPFISFFYKRARRKMFYQIIEEKREIQNLFRIYSTCEPPKRKRIIELIKKRDKERKTIHSLSEIQNIFSLFLTYPLKGFLEWMHQSSKNTKELEKLLR